MNLMFNLRRTQSAANLFNLSYLSVQLVLAFKSSVLRFRVEFEGHNKGALPNRCELHGSSLRAYAAVIDVCFQLFALSFKG